MIVIARYPPSCPGFSAMRPAAKAVDILPTRCVSYFFAGVRVVILHQHFKTPSPGGAIRSWYLAQALGGAGHHVTVLSGHNGDYEVATANGIEIHWLPAAYDNRFGFRDRSKSFLKYVYQVISRPALYRGADICYAISVPLTTGLAAMWMRRRHGIPFIFEVGDLWPDAPIELGFIRNPWLKRFLYALEKRIYTEARSAVALSEPIRQAIEKKARGTSVAVIPNMADTDYYLPSAKDPAVERAHGLEGKFVVSYVGALGYANGLDYILRCATVCQSRLPEVMFVICGEGAEGEVLQASARQLELRNVRFIPFQSRAGVKSILEVTDVVFVCYRPVAILETGSPNKYFDGLAAGKLIVINFSGWIRDEIERESCGIYADPANPETFVERITSFINDRAMLRQYQSNARLLAERKYSRDELSRKFIALVERKC